MESPAAGTSGGVAETAARVAEKRRLVAGERKGMKVMVAVDDSEGSFIALNWTIDRFFNLSANVSCADQITGAGAGASESSMIILVNVQKPFKPVAYSAGPAVYPPTSMVEKVKKAQAENATWVMRRALEMCKDKVKAETLILEGDPKDSICDAAQDQRVDLLVVGSRGLGALKRAFLGSVSDYCAHHVRCPILIVKPPGHF